MESKIRAMIVAAIVGAFLSFAPGRAAAQSPDGAGASLNLTVSGSVTISLGDNGGDPVDKFSTSSVKVSTSSLLNLFSTASGIPYPAGAKLVLDVANTGDVIVEDKSGNLVEDLTLDGFLSIALDPDGAGVWSGQINNNTGAQKFSGSYISQIVFDDTLGDSGTLAGVTKDSYSLLPSI